MSDRVAADYKLLKNEVERLRRCLCDMQDEIEEIKNKIANILESLKDLIEP